MKKIGIVGHFTGDTTFGITKPYMRFFSQFGEVSIISPWEKHVREVDLLVLPGGPDVDIFRYLDENDDIHEATGKPCMQRERFDKVLLPKYMEQKIPVFGICRGHQSLYTIFKGKLKQHMYHESNSSDDRNSLVHSVRFENAFQIKGLTEVIKSFGKKEYKVNSIHHQVVDGRTLPNECTVLATYEGKAKVKDIEAVTYFPHYPAHTVQWHPEEIWDEFSIFLIEHLLNLND